MRLVVGLGNPGTRYEKTRHNVGFMVADELIKNLQAKSANLQDSWKESSKGKLKYWWFEVDGEKIEIVKPLTFMNDSGKALVYIKKKHPKINLEDIYVVHDDLDIELGKYKIQRGRGPKVHNGLKSVYEKLGSKDFWHIRVGVDSRKNGDRSVSGEKYVLQSFTEEEKSILSQASKEVVGELIKLL